jgi:peptidyl-Lys metalloendopeptidase
MFEVKNFLRVALFLSVLVFGAVHAHTSVHLPDGVEMHVEVVRAKVSPSEQALVKVTYTNMSSSTKQLLRWETALEGRVDEDILDVSFEGLVLPYMGRHYKRAAPTAADYVRLQPGESRAVVVDVNTGYQLDYKGEYQISPKASMVSRKVTPVKMELTKDRLVTFKRTPLINGCAGDRPGQIDSALSAAESLAKRARDDLKATPVAFRGSVQRYKEWFGNYSATRWNTVQRNFDRIYATLSGRTITFECDDSVSAFAYVYPSRPYDVYLGQAFWTAPRTGTDSKAGTIIHEVSHFNVVAATDDVVYGQSGARSLANTNPSDAVRNADSHEYFAENTPALPMYSASIDLVASLVGADEGGFSTVEGGNAKLVASVSNLGSSDSASTTLAVRLSADPVITASDQLAAFTPVPALTGGETLEFDMSFKAPIEEGGYWVGVCVVPVSGESNTGNNCSVGMPLTVRKVNMFSVLMLLLMDDE